MGEIKREMHHRSLGREELRRAGYEGLPKQQGRDQRAGILAQLRHGIKSSADKRSESSNLSLPGGMNDEKPRVHEIGQPHVMIGLSENDARLQRWLRCDGKNGPGRLVAKKANDPFVVG